MLQLQNKEYIRNGRIKKIIGDEGMNKALIMVVGLFLGIFILLIVVGTIAINQRDKDIAELTERQKIERKLEGLTQGLEVYGKGKGKEVRLVDGVMVWVHSVREGKDIGTVGVLFGVKNKTEEEYVVNKRYLYIEDSEGNQFPPQDLSMEGADKELKVKGYSVLETEEYFVLPKDYSGNYEGLRLMYEVGEETIAVEAEPL